MLGLVARLGVSLGHYLGNISRNTDSGFLLAAAFFSTYEAMKGILPRDAPLSHMVAASVGEVVCTSLGISISFTFLAPYPP